MTRPVCATRPRSRRGKVTDGWSTSCAPAAAYDLRCRWPHPTARNSQRLMTGTAQQARGRQTGLRVGIGALPGELTVDRARCATLSPSRESASPELEPRWRRNRMRAGLRWSGYTSRCGPARTPWYCGFPASSPITRSDSGLPKFRRAIPRMAAPLTSQWLFKVRRQPFLRCLPPDLGCLPGD